MKKGTSLWFVILFMMLTLIACQLIDRVSYKFKQETPTLTPSGITESPSSIAGSAYPSQDSEIKTPSPILVTLATSPNTVVPTLTDSSYPGPAPGQPPATELVYPGPEIALTTTTELFPASETASITPFLTGLSPTSSSTATATRTADAYPGPITSSPTQPSAVGTPTATQVFAFTATPTSLMFQPTSTSSPLPIFTPTLTSIPPPPWLSSGLQASDPQTLRLASGKIQLLMFFAFWDGPSQAMAPLIHGLEARYFSRMNFIYLDIDDPATELFKRSLGYRIQPHFFLLDEQGITLRQWVGYVQVNDLVQAIDAALN